MSETDRQERGMQNEKEKCVKIVTLKDRWSLSVMDQLPVQKILHKTKRE